MQKPGTGVFSSEGGDLRISVQSDGGGGSSVRHILEMRDQPIFVITSTDGSAHSGMVVTWLTQVSLVGKIPRFAVVISPENFTAKLLMKSGNFRLHLLSADQAAFVEVFGLYSGNTRDKFESVAVERLVNQPVVIKETCGWLLCEVVSRVELGDRVLVFADAIEGDLNEASTLPLLVSRAFTVLSPDVVEKLRLKLASDSHRDALMIEKAVGPFPRLMV